MLGVDDTIGKTISFFRQNPGWILVGAGIVSLVPVGLSTYLWIKGSPWLILAIFANVLILFLGFCSLWSHHNEKTKQLESLKIARALSFSHMLITFKVYKNPDLE